MDRFISLAEALGTVPPRNDEPRNAQPCLEDITDSKQFALAVLNSPEFRRYIVNGITIGDLPTPIVVRLMDYAWGKPVDRVEHSGRVESVTEVRRVVIHVDERDVTEEEPNEDKLTLH